jgi:hypothetical protein
MMSECDCEWQTVRPDEDQTVVWHHVCSRVAGHREAHICLCGETWPPVGTSTEGRDWLRSMLSQFRLVTDDTPDTSGENDAQA